jgi:hypothetical protein
MAQTIYAHMNKQQQKKLSMKLKYNTLFGSLND